MTARKVCIVGNTSFPLDAGTGTQVVDLIRSLGDVVILTRGSAGFDAFVGHVAVTLGLRCFTYPAAGGADNMLRNQEMAKDADEVHGFLNLDDFERGVESGTMHVIDAGLSAGKPTYAYTVVEGRLIHAGSHDAEERA